MSAERTRECRLPPRGLGRSTVRLAVIHGEPSSTSRAHSNNPRVARRIRGLLRQNRASTHHRLGAVRCGLLSRRLATDLHGPRIARPAQQPRVGGYPQRRGIKSGVVSPKLSPIH
jgi:hypothetical protein